MARLLAIDWDAREVRYVLAASRGRDLQVQAAGAAPLGPLPEGEKNLHPGLGETLTAALGPLKLGRVQALVGVDRGSIELLELTLPPAQDTELPELVRNQSMRESSLIAEESLLDFVPMDSDPAEPRRVTAAAISTEQVARIRQACVAAGVTPARLVLRPYAAASLFLRTAPEPPRISLLLNRLADEADLTVLVAGRVAFWRTVRLPGDTGEEAGTRRLLAEVARTNVVVQNQPGCGPVEHVYVLGAESEHELLLSLAPDELSLPITAFEPFAALNAAGSGAAADLQLPADSGRYAALLGMLWDEAGGTAPAIDFLHPRQRPAPPNRRRRWAIAGAVAACALGAFAYSTWSQFAKVNAKNEALAAQLKDLDDTAKKAVQRQQVAQAVREWNAGDVVWLDELRDLSLRFPKARDAVVLRMSLTHARAGGGTVDLQGVVRDPAIVGRMERNLRDEYHEVRSKGVKERVQDKGYAWQFESSVSVAHRDKNQYVSHLPSDTSTTDAKSAKAEK